MIKDFIRKNITAFFPFEPNTEQHTAISALTDFLMSNEQDSVLLFKGYAGTGKTTMLSAAVKMMDMMRQKVVLLAPTGRAAKVFAEYSGHIAYTIHRKIYRQQQFSSGYAGFTLTANLHKATLFIVDEASMVSNENTDKAVFGSGYLLDDLIEYVYSGEGCRLILMGDSAQLPPVSLTESPALSAAYLKRYRLQVSEINLTQVVRQQEDSGILVNATRLREALHDGQTAVFPSQVRHNFTNASATKSFIIFK